MIFPLSLPIFSARAVVSITHHAFSASTQPFTAPSHHPASPPPPPHPGPRCPAPEVQNSKRSTPHSNRWPLRHRLWQHELPHTPHQCRPGLRPVTRHHDSRPPPHRPPSPLLIFAWFAPPPYLSGPSPPSPPLAIGVDIVTYPTFRLSRPTINSHAHPRPSFPPSTRPASLTPRLPEHGPSHRNIYHLYDVGLLVISHLPISPHSRYLRSACRARMFSLASCAVRDLPI